MSEFDNSNYPWSTYEGDPYAPWNQPEEEYYEDEEDEDEEGRDDYDL